MVGDVRAKLAYRWIPMARRRTDPEVRVRFAAWLKEARVDAGIETQQDLAVRLGVHLRLVQKWEGATGLPAAENYQRLLDALNVSIGPLGAGFSADRAARGLLTFGDSLLSGPLPDAVIVDGGSGAVASIGMKAADGIDPAPLLNAICDWATETGYGVYVTDAPRGERSGAAVPGPDGGDAPVGSVSAREFSERRDKGRAGRSPRSKQQPQG